MEDQSLTGREQMIMKIIWKKGEVTVYDIIDGLEAAYGKKYTRSTIRTYAIFLKEKGFISIERRGNYSYVKAVIDEAAYRKSQLEYMRDFWYDGSVSQMASAFSEIVSEEEREDLERLIDGFSD